MTSKLLTEQSKLFLRTGSSLEPREQLCRAVVLTWLLVPPQTPEPLAHATAEAGKAVVPISSPGPGAASTAPHGVSV